jgi:hypothetical protein
LQPSLGVLARRQDERFLMNATEDEQAAPAFADVEATCDRLRAVLRLAGSPAAEGKRVAAAYRNRDTSTAIDPRLAAAVAEARLEAPAQGHCACQALDPPHDLAVGAELAGR